MQDKKNPELDSGFLLIAVIAVIAVLAMVFWSATADNDVMLKSDPIPVQPDFTTTTAVSVTAASINAPAVATEPAVRETVAEVEQPSTTTVFIPSAENNWGFAYPVMHRNFDPHWDCAQFDALNEKYGMVPLSRARATMSRESGCIPGVWNWHVTGPNFNDESFGLYQINMRGKLGPARRELCGLPAPTIVNGIEVDMALFDPETNIRCASLLDPNDRWDPWGY